MPTRIYLDPAAGEDFIIETVPDGLQFIGDKLANHGKNDDHVFGGSDEIDGDRVGVDYVPTNYVSTPTGPFTTQTEELTSHLVGIDSALINANPILPLFSISGSQAVTVPGVYLVDSTPDNPTVITVPNAGTAIGHTYQFVWFTGPNNVDITTVGGTDLIGTATTQSITVVGTSIGIIDDGTGAYAIIYDTRAAAGLTGSGTAGFIPRFSAPSTVTDSILSESGAETITLTQPTLALPADAFNVVSEWDDGGAAEVFSLITASVTDTNSDPTSQLINLSVGGSTQFAVRKDGEITDAAFADSVDPLNRVLSAAGASQSVLWNTRQLLASGSILTLDWQNRFLQGSWSIPVGNFTLTSGELFALDGGFTATQSTPLAANDPILDLTTTWSNGGEVFRLIQGNVTNTASLPASRLIEINVGGTNTFTVSRAGEIMDSANVASVDPIDRTLHHANGFIAVDWGNKLLQKDAGVEATVDWQNRFLLRAGAINCVEWGTSELVDVASFTSIDWENRWLVDALGNTVCTWANRTLQGDGVGNSWVVAQGTTVADNAALFISGTWDQAATTFSALRLNITDTNSLADSCLLRLQVGAVDQFRVRKDGTITVGGPERFSAQATGSITTTSGADIVATGMTLTPGAGTWFVIFSTTTEMASANNTTFSSIWAAGAQVVGTERETNPQNNSTTNLPNGVTSTCIVAVAAGQAIEGRWRTTGGNTGTMNDRSLVVVRVGP